MSRKRQQQHSEEIKSRIKVGFPGRFIIKKIAKQSDYLDNISKDKISDFIGELNKKANI